MIKAKKHPMGRPVAKLAYPMKSPKTINVGYGFGQLRPDRSRDMAAEPKILADLMMLINGIS